MALSRLRERGRVRAGAARTGRDGEAERSLTRTLSRRRERA
jgi:hypothetical protein